MTPIGGGGIKKSTVFSPQTMCGASHIFWPENQNDDKHHVSPESSSCAFWGESVKMMSQQRKYVQLRRKGRVVGRPRKTLRELLASGTFRSDRHGDLLAAAATTPAIAASAETIERPADLTGMAAEIFDRLVVDLGRVLHQRDVGALSELCRWEERSLLIDQELKKLTPTDPSYSGLLRSSGVAAQWLDRLRRRFGLTPGDRPRIASLIQAGSPVARTPTRPQTKLDLMGPPNGWPAPIEKPSETSPAA
jgi:hypothetical protein